MTSAGISGPRPDSGISALAPRLLVLVLGRIVMGVGAAGYSDAFLARTAVVVLATIAASRMRVKALL
ncbi:hypothetical protein GCM10020001_044360 [Nonomuraea salmonea]